MIRIAIAPLACLLAIPAPAQWLNYKTPDLPRLADGKPNLKAPAPRMADGKPDLSGLWRDDTAGAAAMSKAMDAIKPQPWAKEIAKKRQDNYGSDSPGTMCLPPGPMVEMGVGKIMQTPKSLLMLYGGTLYREVYLDGRALEKDPNPSWMGYSVGRWDGDTLVITSNGFNDRTWLDEDGYPHTEALRVTERIRRPDFGHLEIEKTLTDSGALLEPWTVPLKMELDADTELVEYVCNENERDRAHLIGKKSDDKSVPIAPEVLARYVGSYDLKIPETGQILTVTFGADGGVLVMKGVGPTTTLTTVSDNEFSGGGVSIKFATVEKGAMQVLVSTVEGDIKGLRK
jgi:hypothetical protein